MKITSQLKLAPNLLSLFRIVLIPFFVYFYLFSNTPSGHLAASGLFVLSGITDMLDGYIARRCHMITELGKILDPVADKLTQLTILLCLALRYPIFWAMLLVLLVKELLMLIGGLVLLKKHIHPGSAKWFGKLATCFFYISMAFIVLWPKLPPHMVNTIILINILLFAFALMMYIPVFFTLKRGD